MSDQMAELFEAHGLNLKRWIKLTVFLKALELLDDEGKFDDLFGPKDNK